MRYFITFACYGHYLHGDEPGSVARNHNKHGGPLIETKTGLFAYERNAMTQSPYSLDGAGRTAVLKAVKEVCIHRHWDLLAAHVRSNHVHVIVDADIQPERVINTFKSYASRCLNRVAGEAPDRKRWARHGSTRWLWKDDDVHKAVRYVAHGQGEPMALFVSELL